MRIALPRGASKGRGWRDGGRDRCLAALFALGLLLGVTLYHGSFSFADA